LSFERESGSTAGHERTCASGCATGQEIAVRVCPISILLLELGEFLFAEAILNIVVALWVLYKLRAEHVTDLGRQLIVLSTPGRFGSLIPRLTSALDVALDVIYVFCLNIESTVGGWSRNLWLCNWPSIHKSDSKILKLLGELSN
jgi:hypothetical protein